MTLKGQQCIIIGGSSGIGFAIAEAVVKDGGRATLGARNIDRLEKAAARLSAQGNAVSRQVDMLDDGSIKAFLDPIADKSVDALVITASSVVHGAFANTAPDDVAGMMMSKFMGPYRLAHFAMPKMVKGGSITFTSGVLSRRPGRNGAGLAAVNAAVEGLGRALALELGPDLRVNVLSPSMTRSDAYANLSHEEQEAMFTRVAQALPVQRVAEPHEIAEAAMLLMTNGFLTGHVLDIDGGHLIQR